MFTVTLSSPPAFPVDVDYQTSSGTAIGGADFTAALGDGPLRAPGDLEDHFGGHPAGRDRRGRRDLPIDLANPVGHHPRRRSGGRHHRRCQPPRDLRRTCRRPRATGARPRFLFTIALDAPPTVPVSVRYSTDRWAPLPAATTPTSRGILTFAVGEVAKSVSVPVLGDRAEERDEFFKLVLRYPTGGLYLDRSEALGWIVNDDFTGPPKVSISDASLGEGNAGAMGLAFTVRLSRVAAHRAEHPLLHRQRHGHQRPHGRLHGHEWLGDLPDRRHRADDPVPVLGDVTDETARDVLREPGRGPGGVVPSTARARGTDRRRRSVSRPIYFT